MFEKRHIQMASAYMASAASAERSKLVFEVEAGAGGFLSVSTNLAAMQIADRPPTQSRRN